jgi:hypothetical protein
MIVRAEVYPAFKAKYVDSNKVHYVFREMLVGGGAEVAICASNPADQRAIGVRRSSRITISFRNSSDRIPSDDLHRRGLTQGTLA